MSIVMIEYILGHGVLKKLQHNSACIILVLLLNCDMQSRSPSQSARQIDAKAESSMVAYHTQNLTHHLVSEKVTEC